MEGWKRINQPSGKENGESEPHSAALMSALTDNKETVSKNAAILDLRG